MIDNKLVQTIVSKVTRKGQPFGEHNIMHPEREWFIGLSTAVVVLAVGSIWCVQLYFDYSDSIETISPSAQIEQTIYREKEIDQALNEFAERKEKQSNLRTNLTSTPAPKDTNIQSIITIPDTGLDTGLATSTDINAVATTTETETPLSETSDNTPIDDPIPLTPRPR